VKIELISITPDSERIIEMAARTCYQSGDLVADGTAADLLPKLLAMGHETPFEHAYATFRISGSPHAQWEIREACEQMRKILHEQAPHVFADLLPSANA